MKVVYIAGKYRAPTPWDVEQNIQAAAHVAAKVLAAGLMPLCPHLNTARMEGVCSDEFILAGTMELLRRCDAVMMVHNWRDSAGARAELAEAHRLGLPVFGTGREFADYLGRTTIDGGDTSSVALTTDAAIDNLVDWAKYDERAEAKWPHPRGDGEPREI